jgi:probable phosphoglycerate mutase
MHLDLFQRLEISTCSVTALAFTRMGPRLLAYNDTGSLEHLKPKPEEPAEAQHGAPEASGTSQPAPAEALAEATATSEATAPENGVEQPAAP